MKEVFVGRKEEIEQFFEFLKKKDCPAFVVIGEPGIGKTSFLKEICGRLRGQSKGKVFVGYHWVPFNPSMADPFVGVLEDLMNDVAASPREQVRDILKRIETVCKKTIVEKGGVMAKMIARAVGVKILGEEGFKIFEKYYREFLKTPSIFSFADDIVSQYKTEFINDYIGFFKKLVDEFKDVDFVLVIDQFERAQMPSCEDLLNFIMWKPDRVHVLVSFKVEKGGIEKFAWIKPNLVRQNANILELRRLSVEEIREWMLLLGKDFSYPELRKIRELSDGFPFTLSEWTKTSKECDLKVLEDVRGRYCEFIKWRSDGLKDDCKLMLHRLSVLLQPLSVEDYEKLTGIEVDRCGLFLNELVDKWIFNKYGDTFWFRHELIRFCIEQDLTKSEKRKYHETAAQFFQQRYDEASKANKEVDFDVALGCAYHWHSAGKHRESLEHNAQLAMYSCEVGLLDVAEACCLRITEDSNILSDEDPKIAAQGNLANIYHIWGRVDEAFNINSQVLEYYRKKGDRQNEATALHQRAVIEQERGNYENAEKLYRESIEIDRKLENWHGLSRTLHQLATIYLERSEYNEAEKLCKENLDISQRFNDQYSLSKAFHQLAVIHQIKGEHDEAKKLFHESLDIKRRIGDKMGMASSLGQFAMTLMDTGNYLQAEKLYRQVLEISKEVGDKSGMSVTLHQLAIIYHAKGEYQEAIKLLKQSLDIFTKLGDQRNIALSYGQLGRIYESLGKPIVAADYYLRALNIFQKIGDKLNIAKAKTACERVTAQRK